MYKIFDCFGNNVEEIEIFGVGIFCICILVKIGCNIFVVIEAAVMNYCVKEMGFDVMCLFEECLINFIV